MNAIAALALIAYMAGNYLMIGLAFLGDTPVQLAALFTVIVLPIVALSTGRRSLLFVCQALVTATYAYVAFRAIKYQSYTPVSPDEEADHSLLFLFGCALSGWVLILLIAKASAFRRRAQD